VAVSQKGGYAGTSEMLGTRPVGFGAGAAPPHLVALDREVLARMARALVVSFHSAGKRGLPTDVVAGAADETLRFERGARAAELASRALTCRCSRGGGGGRGGG